MAGGFRRGNRRRAPKLEARGELASVEREGPFKEWLGMPDLYRYHLVVDGVDYSCGADGPIQLSSEIECWNWSVPYAQNPYSEPGPPSSQSPSLE